MFEEIEVMLTKEEIDVAKRSLHCYRDMLSRIEESERVIDHPRVISPELARVVELQHRLGTYR